MQRGNVGLIDPFAQHRKAPIGGHVAAFEDHLKNSGVSPCYLKEHIRRLRRVLEHGSVRTLGELKPEVVESFMASLVAGKTAGTTMRNKYLDSAKAFARLVRLGQALGSDPLVELKQAGTCGGSADLTEHELARLLTAARERPLLDMRTIRSGKGKGTRVERLKKAVTEAKADRLGWERSLIYKTLVYTGLRRGELAAMEVRHLTLDGAPPRASSCRRR